MYTTYIFIIYLVEGDDFTVMSPDVFEATFTSGSMIGNTACDIITIVDDGDLEGTQFFGIQISGSTPSGGQIITTGAFTGVSIEDNEGTHCVTSVICTYVHITSVIHTYVRTYIARIDPSFKAPC